MKKRITKTVAMAALIAGAATGAQATEGWYGRADAGYTIESDFAIHEGGANFGLSAPAENDWSEYLGLGYAFAGGLRLEGEVSHRFNRLEATPLIDQGGDVHAWAAMVNAYYDFNRGGAFEPYLGVGVGAARLNANAHDGTAPAHHLDDSDTAVAYQAMAGVAIGLSERLDLDIGYRYFVVPESQYGGTGSGAPWDAYYDHQAVTVGLRWQFAAPYVAPPPPPPVAVSPPPPPPPVQVACPTSEFVVYFEWDRSNLNQAALETIDAAVNRARQCNLGGLVVVGHTDTSGSTAYNEALSNRRASVVSDALVARGIAATSIRAEAHGETDLARATRDGVREPLNRRTAVTITFR